MRALLTIGLIVALRTAAAAIGPIPDAAYHAPVHATVARIGDTSTAEVLSVQFPSAITTPYPANNTVYGEYYMLRRPAPVPACVVLHALKVRNAGMERAMCRHLSQAGINALLLTLPYHMQRTPPGTYSGQLFVTGDAQRSLQAFTQAAADAVRAATWLSLRPEVDPKKIGVAGISLGAIVAHLVMGLDPRFVAGAALLGGGDLAGILWRGLATERARQDLQAQGYTFEDVRRLFAPVDPLTYASLNRPRHVLMVNAARDLVVPTADALKLWNALGRPPIVWLNTNHFGIGLNEGRIFSAAAAYLAARFAGHDPPRSALAGLSPLPVKFGAAFGLHSVGTYAIGVEVAKIVPRSLNRSWVHADLLLAGTGLFASVAATLHTHLDVGLGVRLTSPPRRAVGYVLIHFTI